MTDQNETGVIHRCPSKGSGITPCCGKTPFELPTTDRISIDPFEATCGEPTPAPAPAPELRGQIAAAINYALLPVMPRAEYRAHATSHAADAVLAVPAIRGLAEVRDALRVALGDRDAALAEEQQLREEVAEARGQLERVRKAIAERRTELAEYEAEHEPSSWSDAVSVTCSRIEDALRIFPEPLGIPIDALGQQAAPAEPRPAEEGS
ncbi:hypothetical protein [Streptomyces sp. NBC_01794]|uniref:hypothetical protein n=1 Tax=Streptomyces sp. NBC_01794 TaxID=2975942 RepID=UPI003085DBAC|nr:hypothetical protein OIE54_12150 [Streptomyces sp. NBC_01794]